MVLNGKSTNSCNVISIDKDFAVFVRFFYYTTRDSIYLAYELSDYEDGTSYFDKVSKADCSMEWSTNIPVFNLSAPIIRDKYAYVAGIGFIGQDY